MTLLPEPGDEVMAGLDMGLRTDSSALVIVHRRNHVMRVAELVELRPKPGQPLKPSEVMSRFAATMKRHGCKYAVGDNHYRESVTEHLQAHGMAFVEGPTQPAEAYIRTRALMREGLVRLPKHDRLLLQMRKVQGRPTSGGGMSIQHPRDANGGHGDIVAAFVLAVFQLSPSAVIPTPAPEPGTAEHAALARIARAKYYAEQQKPASRSRRGSLEIDRGGGKHRARRMS